MAYYYYQEYNRLELHYWLEHNMHSMDAIVQNRCEQEFLSLLTEIAASFNSKILIETEPLAEGGLRRYYKILSKEEGKKAIITTAVITAITTAILVTPITASINKLVEIAIEKIFEDKATKDQTSEINLLEIEKLKQEIKIDSISLSQNFSIEKSQANFYSQLRKDQRVEKLTVVFTDEKNNRLNNDLSIERENFNEFKIREQNLVVQEEMISEIENATIEVVSPVFSSGSDKWKGIFEGKPITFKILSIDFDRLVQTGAIQFKKGTTITCLLLERRINNRIKYEVLSVNKYLE